MKIVTVDFPPFVGTVVMPDYLTLPQVLAYEDANDEIRELRETQPAKASLSRMNSINIAVILSIVTEWKVSGIPEGVTAETFPFTPRLQSAKMLAQLTREITAIYTGEIDIPNA